MTTPTSIEPQRLRHALHSAAALLAERHAQGYWVGELSSSALSTATAVTALAVAAREDQTSSFSSRFASGLAWLAKHQNDDGGWGDTTRSLSNLSTTVLAWAAFGAAPQGDATHRTAVARAQRWLQSAVGSLNPDTLAPAVIARYGKDRTFSVPILTMCALAGRLGPGRDAWRHVLPLPFELAACPHRWFAALNLPVVSYALPALIAIGQARHCHRPSRNPIARLLRHLTRVRTLRVLTDIQPTNGGFLEATPLTSFVTMSLAGSGQVGHPVTRRGLEFLLQSQRPDGSWPIDTNLSTWMTTLSVNALGGLLTDHLYAIGHYEEIATRFAERAPPFLQLVRWLVGQQYRSTHPYTHAAPGGWAWTDLPGGVPDADDTSGALVALEFLLDTVLDDRELERLAGAPSLIAAVEQARMAGVRWLLGLQNRDGGFPTFCRGWGALPFDRSNPDITAHALRALVPPLLRDLLRNPPELVDELRASRRRGTEFLVRSQQPDGSWIPLWFGNEHAPDDANPIYGTSRVLLGLREHACNPEPRRAFERGLAWLCAAQRPDGSWGGDGRRGSIEETGLALEALADVTANHGAEGDRFRPSIQRATQWLVAAVEDGTWREPSPIGFYFAKLWYYDRLYPMIFTVAGLQNAAPWLGVTRDG